MKKTALAFALWAVFGVNSLLGDTVVVFNELMYHPATNEPAFEWVELHNQHAVDVDISGWSITGGINYTFASNTVVKGNAFLVVASSPTDLMTATGLTNVLGPFVGRLANSGDTIRLRNNNGRIMDEISYGVEDEWPVAPDGSGASLAKIDSETASGPAKSWTSSEQMGGTPGAQNFPGVGAIPPDTRLVAVDAVWKYEASGTDLGASWSTNGYNDSGWSSRAAFTNSAIPGLFNTGVGANGVVLANNTPDPHYLLTANAQGGTGTNALAILNHPNWLANDAASSFIGVLNPGSSSVAAGNYYYQTTFSLAGFIPSTAQLNLVVAVDNNLTDVFINGVSSGLSTSGFAAFNPPLTLTSGFVAGVNTLEFRTLNLDGPGANPHGFRATLSGSGLAVNTNSPLPLGRSTYYFRKSFTFSGNPAFTQLRLNPIIADGAVVYLNGAEVFRQNMPVGAPSYSTAASTNVLSPNYSGLTQIPANSLLAGNNVLAVEVHQAAGSPDGPLFGADLISTPVAVSPAALTVAFNEISSATNAQFFLELVNYGTNALALDGFVIARDGATNNEYVFPATSLAAGAYLAVTSATLGFHPESGDKLYLLPADRSKVIDAVVVKNSNRARSPEITGPWLRPNQTTPGGINSFAFRDEIVINEIMYHHALLWPISSNTPPQDSKEAWIELFNRSTNLVDLTGWELDGGVAFQFEAGTSIAAGGYLVVAKDTNALRALYPAINIVGNFSKDLSHRSDHIVLKDPSGNPANEVRYFTSGHWPEYPDGGGSSLELRDPQADNSRAQAWAASIESGKSSWSNYSYRMTAQNVIGPQQWNDFLMGLLSAGECLVDDISVIESPSTTPVEFLSNGNFENGLTGWRVIGTHTRSQVEVDPDNMANHVLHVIATGPQEHMHNHIETTFAAGRSVVNGREYQISFRAKWIAGNNLLNTRLYFDRAARTSVLPTPSLNGTPGAQNSRFEANIGPTFSDLPGGGSVQHRPVIPQASETVTVSVRPQDPQGINSAQVWWSANGGAWNNAAMTAGSNGVYSGTIPGMSAGSIVQFYIRAVDGLGAPSTYPPAGSNSAALYIVNDGQANLPLAHNVRIIMTPANRSLLHGFTNVMSNDTLPCTVVYDERRAYYDVGVRLKGSERGRYSDTRVSFHLEFPPDDLFRGVHPVMLIDRSGAGDSTANKQQEIVIRHMLWRAGGIPGPQADICRLIAPLSTHTGPGIFGPRHEDEFIDTAYNNGGDGNLYELELIYYPTSTNAFGYKNPQPDNVTGVDISDLGNDKELYRYNFIIKNHRDGDDYSPFIRFAKTFSLPSGPTLENQARDVMDVNEWMRAFALVTLCGVGDSYTFGNNHNLLMYARPSDQKMLAFPWDMDFSFNRATTAALVGDQNLSRIINLTPNLRCFYAHILDIIGSTYNTSYMTYWANHYDDFCPGQSFSGIPAYIQGRANFAISTINAAGGNAAFAVNGPSEITTGTNLITLTGTAPVQVKTIEVNGAAYALTWTSLNTWSLRLPVPSSTNTLVFQTYDVHNNLLPTWSATNTVIYTGTVVDPRDALAINEIMYHPAVSNASYVEILNSSATFAFDLSDWRLSGVDYTFPSGTVITNKQILVIAKNRAAFANAYGSTIPVFGEFDGNLDPEGEILALVKPAANPNQSDQLMDAVRYEALTPWPTNATNNGVALQLIDASQDNSRVSNWSDGSGWRFATLTGQPGTSGGLSTNAFTFTMDSAGDFYIDDLSLVAGSVPASGANLFENGDFETGSLPAWQALGNHSASTVSTAVKHAGNASLHVISTGAGSVPNNTLVQSNIIVTTTNLYTLSFWYLPNTNANNLNYRLTSNFRSGVSQNFPVVGLKPSFSSPGSNNTTAVTIEPYPLLWINEVQPNNTTGITDNNAERDPWIELFNSGPTPITLDGYSLANNYTNLAQWPFPNGTTINPGEFKVLFADGQPGQSTANELHTNFRLDPTNGSIVLSKAVLGGGSRILDYINYTGMEPNFSYGSYPDGQVVYRQRFYYNTPGASNNPAPIPVIINEWLASNTNTIVDPANGRYEDWIELYNFGTTTIDLSGYWLTDNLSQKKNWQIPNGTVIGPGAFLLIWADNAATNSTPTDLHAGFQLSRNGEEIGLFTPEPELLRVDTVAFGPQGNNVSQGRYPDGNFAGVLYFMTTPTPAGANVIPANQFAPVLPAIANRTLNERATLNLTVLASDEDVPVQTLTYSLDPGAPAGASINARSGLFNWTPSEAQGGVVYPVTIRVSDNGSPTFSDSKSFTITVNKVNSAPDVPPLAPRTLPENTSLNFTVAASDSDLPAQQLSFALTGAPSGATIDASSGLFSWTPTETQGPSTNNIQVRVSDNGSPSMTTTQLLTIFVTEVNSPPALTNPGNVTIDELKGYTNFLVATDSDIPVNTVTFALVQPFVSGVQLNSQSGRLTWTPTEAQGPSNYVVTVRAFDNGSPSMSTTQAFTIVVNEVNNAPVLTNLNNSIRTNNELTSITLTNRATDSDVPTNNLTYQLLSAPSGATLDTASGLFSWTPSVGQGPSSNNIVVRVFDNGSPSLSATQRFAIIVAVTDPRITDVHSVSATQLSISWQIQSGQTYELQYCDDLTTGPTCWQPLTGAQITTSGSTQTATIDISGNPNPQRFYRVAKIN